MACLALESILLLYLTKQSFKSIKLFNSYKSYSRKNVQSLIQNEPKKQAAGLLKEMTNLESDFFLINLLLDVRVTLITG